MESYYLYRHVRLDKNQPFYVGIGLGRNFLRAFQTHNRTDYWKKIAAKGFEVEIIMDGLGREEAIEKEKEFILSIRMNAKNKCQKQEKV